MTDVYIVHEDKGGPPGQWFHQVLAARPLTDVEITRARAYCAGQAKDADELREFLDMLGIR